MGTVHKENRTLEATAPGEATIRVTANDGTRSEAAEATIVVTEKPGAPPPGGLPPLFGLGPITMLLLLTGAAVATAALIAGLMIRRRRRSRSTAVAPHFFEMPRPGETPQPVGMASSEAS